MAIKKYKDGMRSDTIVPLAEKLKEDRGVPKTPPRNVGGTTVTIIPVGAPLPGRK